MTTTGNFSPPGTPPCPAPMTRAALLALRTAGALRTECHYIITDGPVIGTAGNTSPTTIELHAVTPSDIAREAKIHTNFDNVAYTGNYNIDAGAAGSINAITDHNNNQIFDEDDNAPTVHTQFPYHLSGPTLRDNVINDCSLPGWSALTASVDVQDNNLQETTVDLTGVTAGYFLRNAVNGGTFTSHTPTTNASDNTLDTSTVDAQATTGQFAFRYNAMLTGEVSSDAATAVGLFSVLNNVIGGNTNGYRIRCEGKSGTTVSVAGNRLFSRGSAPVAELLVSGAGLVVNILSNTIVTGAIVIRSAGNTTLSGSTLGAATITQDAAATNPLSISQSEVNGATVQQTANALGTALLNINGGSRIFDGFVVTQDGTGGITVGGSALHSHGGMTDDILQQGGSAVLVNDSDITAAVNGAASNTLLNQAATGSIAIAGSHVVQALGAVATRLVGATGSVSIIGCTLNGARFVHGATNTGPTFIQNVDINSSLLTHNGAGSLNMGSGVRMAGSGVTLAATSTRGVTISGGVYDSATINQNRTGGTALDNFQSSYMGGQASVTLNGAVDPGAAQTIMNRARVEASSVVTITDPAGTIVLQNSELVNATMTFPAGCLLNTGMRFHRCSVNVGAFAHDGTIVDGPFATVFTASNNSRLANASFSDVI